MTDDTPTQPVHPADLRPARRYVHRIEPYFERADHMLAVYIVDGDTSERLCGILASGPEAQLRSLEPILLQAFRVGYACARD